MYKSVLILFPTIYSYTHDLQTMKSALIPLFSILSWLPLTSYILYSDFLLNVLASIIQLQMRFASHLLVPDSFTRFFQINP